MSYILTTGFDLHYGLHLKSPDYFYGHMFQTIGPRLI